MAGTSPAQTPVPHMPFYESSLLLLEPVASNISRNRGAMLARGALQGALARRAGAGALAFAVPGVGEVVGAVALAMTAWDIWNALQGGTPLPMPGLSVPYPAVTTDTNWEIDISYRLETAPGGILPSRTEGFVGIPFYGRITDIRAVSEGAFNSFKAYGFNSVDGNISVSLGGGNEQFLPPRLLSLNVRYAGTVNPLPPSGLPQLAPGVAPISLDQPITLDIPQTNDGYPYPVQIPALIRSPGLIGQRPVPVIYDPSLPADQRDALPQLWITPEGVQVGQGERSNPVVVIPDGAASTIDLVNPASDYRRRNPPSVVVCQAEPTPPSDCCNCDDIRAIVIEELDSKFPPSRPNELRTTVLFPAGSGEVVLPSYSQWVEVRIVTPPPNVRSQSGGANSPAVKYNGWISFGATETTGERTPLHYDVASFPVPKDATGFSWLIYDGGTAEVTVGYLMEV